MSGRTTSIVWKRRFSIAGMVLALFLTGCFGQEPEPPVTLTWWVTYAQDSAEYPVLEALAERYTEKTGRQIELVSVPWTDMMPRTYGSNILAIEQEAGRGPDLWGPVPHSWTGGFVADGQVLALERDQIQDIDQYLDDALWACQVEQQQYGVPVLIDSVALLYNRELIATPPETMEDLVAFAQDFTDPAQDRWGLVFPLLSQYHVYPFIEGHGGYVFKCIRNECTLDDVGLNNEGAVQAVQFLSDLYIKEGLFPEQLADRTVMDEHSLHLFTSGQAAMMIEGSWVLSDVHQSGINYGVTALPPMPGATRAPRPWTLVQAFYVSAQSSLPDETIDFVNYLAGPESAVDLQHVLGQIPVRRDILRRTEFKRDQEIQNWYGQIQIGVPMPNILELEYVWYPWGQALDIAIPGLSPVQETLDQAVEQIKSYFEETD